MSQTDFSQHYTNLRTSFKIRTVTFFELLFIVYKDENVILVQSTLMVNLSFSGRRQLTSKGKKYSLPAPQGGKHALNPILCADQPLPQQRLSKSARAKTNALDPDYIAGTKHCKG
jgi:hypothetical protein